MSCVHASFINIISATFADVFCARGYDHSTDGSFCLASLCLGRKKSVYSKTPSRRAWVSHNEAIPMPTSPMRGKMEVSACSSESSADISSISNWSCFASVNRPSSNITMVNKALFDAHVKGFGHSKSASEEVTQKTKRNRCSWRWDDLSHSAKQRWRTFRKVSWS